MRRIVVGFAVALGVLLASQRAHASFHIMKITQVYGGSTAHPTAQYVMIEMLADGQDQLSGHSIDIFNAAGTMIGTVPLTTLVNGTTGKSVLIGSSSVNATFGVMPDFTLSTTIPVAGGKVCFDTVDCVGWGTYTPTVGDQVGTAWNDHPAAGLVLGRAMKRKGTSPAYTDTDVSNNDFVMATPAPKNYAGMTGTLPAATCGNNVVEGIERCDDNNTTSMDGCSATCEPELCGDKIVNRTGEICDDGNTTQGDGCDNNCTITACGNGVKTGIEQCDDGNLTDGDNCDSNCTPTGCGNHIMTSGEACDDGNVTNGDGCDSNCTVTACGNGIVTMGEFCDPPNGTTCSATCQRSCGAPNDCMDTDPCTSGENCVAMMCTSTMTPTDDTEPCTTDGCDMNGVFHTAMPNGSTCTRSGMPAGLCIAGSCTPHSCGDGFVNTGVEECDDGNQVDDDACTNACTSPACGDHVVQTGEECDDGNATDNDGCSTACKMERCGDQVVQANEECDDGGTTAEDGCSPLCKNERCGDGVVQTTEDCDDGNTRNDDACTTLCALPRCGDGLVSGGEACDDGNDKNDDDCTTKCAFPDSGGGGCCEASSNGATTAWLGMIGVALALRRRTRRTT